MSVDTYLYLWCIAKNSAFLAVAMVWLSVTSSNVAEFIVKASSFFLAFAFIKLIKKRFVLRCILVYMMVLSAPYVYTFLEQRYSDTPVPLFAYCVFAILVHTYALIRECRWNVSLMRDTQEYKLAERACVQSKKSLKNLTDATVELFKSIFK